MGKRSIRGQAKNKNKALYLVLVIIGVIMGVLVFYVATPTGQVVSSTGGDYDDLASCLTDSGAIFYGTEWCGFCQRQKEMFGESLELINYVDCDQNRDICASEGIRGYPTWKIGGELHSGMQQLERLSELSGCSV